MSVLLRDNFGYLHLLVHCPEPQRKVLLTTATPEQVHVICEVCHNLSKGVIPISNSRLEALRPHAHDIRLLAASSVPFKTKKIILAQEGSSFVKTIVSPLMDDLSLFLL